MNGIGERLGVVLRPPREEDTERWLEMLADPVYRSYGAPDFVDVPSDAATAAERFEQARVAWEERRPGTLVVADAADDRVLGDIAWRWTTSEKLGVADLGYAVHPAERGRGVGRQGITLLVRWLLDPAGRGLPRVQLDHSTENTASCRVALAAGLGREGIREGFLPLRGLDGVVRRHDVCLHGTTVRPPLPAVG